MTAAIDAIGTPVSLTNVTSFTDTSLTVGTDPNRALILTLTFGWTTGSHAPQGSPSVVWDSSGAHQDLSIINRNYEDNPNSNALVLIFGLVAPVSGNKTLAVSWTTGGAPTDVVEAVLVSVKGAAQTGILFGGLNTTTFNASASNAGDSTNPTLSLVTTDNSIGIGCCVSTGGSTFTSVNYTTILNSNTTLINTAVHYDLNDPGPIANFSINASGSVDFVYVGVNVNGTITTSVSNDSELPPNNVDSYYGTTSFIDNYLTVGTGPNRALVYAITFDGISTTPTDISVVWDVAGANQPLSLIVQEFNVSGTSLAMLWGLVNPISGNKTMTVSWTNSVNEAEAGGCSFSGVDQTGGTTTFNHINTVNGTLSAGGVATITCTTTENDAVATALVGETATGDRFGHFNGYTSYVSSNSGQQYGVNWSSPATFFASTAVSTDFAYVATNIKAVASTITGVSPAFGSTAGGTSVTITGTNFISTTGVMFGTTSATSFTVNGDTQISAISPAETTGTVDVTVTTPEGTSPVSSADRFTYQAPGTVAVHNEQLLSATFSGLGSSGSVSVSGLRVGDKLIWLQSPQGGTAQVGGFEIIISVNDQIQQLSTSNLSTWTFNAILARGV